MLKKSLLSTAVTVALALSAGQASAVMIDMVGAGGSGVLNNGSTAVHDVVTLDWKPDNAIAIGAISTPTKAQGGPTAAGQLADERYIQNVAQGKLNSFGVSGGGQVGTEITPGNYLQNREFTFQASFYTFTSGIGTATVANRLAPGESFFRLYADSAKDSNDITGGGYGNGKLILEGKLSTLTGSFTDFTRLGAPTDQLDKFGGDNQSGVRTHVGNGSNTLGINITFLDNAYFLGDVAKLLLTLNYNDTTNLATPFISANPSDSVVGVVPSYSLNAGGQKVNGADCLKIGTDGKPFTSGATETGVVSSRCDFHFQSDASGAFQVPEPGSLALVGLALSAVGFAGRRRKAA